MSAEPRSLDLLHFLQLLPHRTAISSIVRMSPRHDLRGRHGVVLNRQAIKIPIGFIVVPVGVYIGSYKVISKRNYFGAYGIDYDYTRCTLPSLRSAPGLGSRINGHAASQETPPSCRGMDGQLRALEPNQQGVGPQKLE